MHTEKKIIIVLSIALLAALAVVAALSLRHPLTSGGVAGMPVVPAAPTSADGLMHTLSGQVTAVGNSSLTVSAILPGKTTASSVTVTAASNAALTLQTPTDPAVFAKEMAAYQKQIASTSATYGATPPPMPYTAKTIALSDIKAGMSVIVTPVANTKQDAASITAQSITLYAAPVMPSVTTVPPMVSPAGNGTTTNVRPPQPVIVPPPAK
jgi:hypothetical protein